MQAAFAPIRLEALRRVDQEVITEFTPDVVLLHNTPADRCGQLQGPLTIQYLHSRIRPAAADVTVACSSWLSSHYPSGDIDGVLYQPVDIPERAIGGETRALRQGVIVGRICTPTPRKWPSELLPEYRFWSEQNPDVCWEFVGCPTELEDRLADACHGRARFLSAGWSARRWLRHWDAMLYHHPTLPETFGRTVAEALMAGCIPIVDDRGGFREQVRPHTGFLCRDIEGFNQALRSLRSPQERRTRSRAAAEDAYQRFSGAAFQRRFNHLLSAVAEHRANE